VLDPESVPAPGAWGRDDGSIHIPMEGYAEEGRSRRTIFFGLLLLLVAVGGVSSGVFLAQGGYGYALWQRYEVSLRQRLTAAVRGMNVRDGVNRSPTANPVANPPANPVAPNPMANPAANPAAANPVANPTTNPPTNPAAANPAANLNAGGESRSGAAAAPAPLVVPEPEASMKGGVKQPSQPLVAAVRQRREAQVSPRSRAAEQDEAVGGSDASSGASGAGAPVTVSPSVMEANLISSRVPAYPEAARGDHVEGRVVMQAVISKSGMVGHLRVIEGNPVLRGAATEAVSKWRYRPYLVNGEPVEVVTTVSVDFILGQ
jgi:TonB family protein